ncbi:DUF4175 family protein [Paremcibacter congregatus]|uniref:DUF4175 family protein n=1 Tax=Paremcibacter congregatus TaxID=2043170 RepID=UPI0030EE1C43|tara:strand:+ start:1399 stop:3333 length:1935 start_codon:yes stop_codon:yes gene_type:complete
MITGLLQAGTLYCLYLALSLADPWGYLPPTGHMVFYVTLFLLMMGCIFFGLLGRTTGRLKVSAKWALLAVMITGISALLAGPDRTRLLELAVKPRAVFDYPVPEITVTVTPPLYSGRAAFTEQLPVNAEASSGLTPVPEGSNILVQVRNSPYAPTLIAGRHKLDFLTLQDGAGFAAGFTVKNEITWQIREGSRLVGAWPIVILEDEAPVVARADFRKLATEDGLFGVSLDLSDDYGLTQLSVGVVRTGEAPSGMQDVVALPVKDMKEFSGDFYLNMAASELAGHRVDLIVAATDAAGQQQVQAIPDIILPEKTFVVPAARQIMDVRKGIKADPDSRNTLARRLMALGLAPDDGMTSPVYYLALRSAYRRLMDPDDVVETDSALDILWDLANKLEDGAVGRLKNNELALLARLKLALYQHRDMADVRGLLQEIDKNVVLFLRGQSSLDHYTSIDVPALRKLYGKILTHAHYKKFDKAIDLVAYLEHGFIYPDKGILAGQGYERFQIIRKALITVHDLEKSQRQIMSAAFKRALTPQMTAGAPQADKETLQDQRMQSWVMRQRSLGILVGDLGRELVKSGVDASALTVAASDLIRDVVSSMEAGDMEEATQYQSQIMTLLQSLKKKLDQEMQLAATREAENNPVKR